MEDERIVYRTFKLRVPIEVFHDIDHYIAVFKPLQSLNIGGIGDSEWDAIEDLETKLQRWITVNGRGNNE